LAVTLTPAALPSGTLLWSYHKDGDQRAWFLQTGGASLASLTWEKRFGSIATARTAGASWRYERQGIFRKRFLISDQAGNQIAEYSARWTGAGTITLRNGRRFAWKPGNFWSTRWHLLESDNTRLLEYRLSSWSFQSSAEATVAHAALKYRELPFFLTFCWYLCILGRKDAAHA
jgi:hypothetical protein